MLDSNNNWQFTYTAPVGGSTLTINNLNVADGETVTVDWGDSTTTALTGTNGGVTNAYAEGTYTVTLLGTPHIIRLDLTFQSEVGGDIGDWGQYLPSSLTRLDLSYNSFIGDVSGWGQYLGGVSQLYLRNNSFTGNLSGWGQHLISAYLFLQNNSFIGDLSDWGQYLSTDPWYVYLNDNGFTGDVSGWGQHLSSSLRILNLSTNSFTGYSKFLCQTQLLDTLPTSVTFKWDEATYNEWMPADIRADLVDNYDWSITDAGSSGEFFHPFRIKHWDATNNTYMWR